MFFRHCNFQKTFIIKTLLRGSSRWAAASLQDKSLLIGVLHGNYAAGYLWGLRDVFSDNEIYKASGVNIIEFQKRITDIQDDLTAKLIKVCPQYTLNLDDYFSKIYKINES